MSTLAVGTIKSADSAAPVIQNSSGTEIGKFIKAWINFDGYGASIRGSFNISSVTDNGTGDYTFIIDNDFPDVNYCWVGTATTATGTESTMRNIAFSSSSSSTSNSAHLATQTRVSVATQNSGANLHDARQVMVQWIR
jgi:hypothetical protein